ncbi:tripartite motif-containing protein 29-like [Gastrophryne carolinensis]
MAACASLGDELSCSICLSFYTEPVSLRCGHSFCRSCIGTALETQEESGVYSCPECREKYTERPALEKNRKLCNIVENFRSTQTAEIHCTYCVETREVAVKSCLQCETFMCAKHLEAHNKTVDHVLLEPTASLRSKKCPIHKKLLEYFCSEDAVCLCVSCCLVGKHKGHKVELLDEASEKKKETLRGVLKKLSSKNKDLEEKIRRLQEHEDKVHEKADDEKKRVEAMFEDIRRKLEIQEKRVLGEISGQKVRISQSIFQQIRKLEAQKDALSKEVSHMEELCNAPDPVTVLQDQQSERGDRSEEEPSVPHLDVLLISRTLGRAIDDVFTNIKPKHNIGVQVGGALLPGVGTAPNFEDFSKDLKAAADTQTLLDRLESVRAYSEYLTQTKVKSSHRRHRREKK